MTGDLAPPFQPPPRRSGRHRMKFDGPRARGQCADVRSADKTQLRMVEIISDKIGDDSAECACTHELIEPQLAIVIQRHRARGLIGIIPSDHALSAGGIVGTPDSGEQQQPYVVKRECRQHYELRRLADLLSGRHIDIRDARRVLLVFGQINPDDMRAGTKLEIRLLEKDRQESRLWTRLCKVLAAKALAIAAHHTSLQPHPFGVRVCPGQIRGWLRIWAIPELYRPFGE